MAVTFNVSEKETANIKLGRLPGDGRTVKKKKCLEAIRILSHSKTRDAKANTCFSNTNIVAVLPLAIEHRNQSAGTGKYLRKELRRFTDELPMWRCATLLCLVQLDLTWVGWGCRAKSELIKRDFRVCSRRLGSNEGTVGEYARDANGCWRQ